MKETYVPAELELIKIAAADIITASGDKEEDDGTLDESGWT